ncbi:MAG: pitrilysin family protein [Pseudomonadota bacterium]
MIRLIIICALIILPTHISYGRDVENTNKAVLDIQEVRSPGGLTAWLVQDNTLPIISMRFSFRGAGAVNNSAEQQGLSRLLSNTLDEGAGDLDSQNFQKGLSDNSISLSFSSGRDHFGGALKTLTRNKEEAFEHLKLALNEPRFDEEPLERMKQANLSRIRNSVSDPNWITARIYNDVAYQDHPYALNSGGTLSTLPQITSGDLRDYKNKFLTQDRLVIGVMGDISPEKLSKIIDDIFENLPKGDSEENPLKREIQNQGKLFFHEKDVPQTFIMMGLPAIDENHPDYFALQIMNHVFGASGFGSYLMEKAREKRGLTYGIYSYLTLFDQTKTLNISTSTQNSTASEMLSVIQSEIENFSDKVTEEDIQKAKDYLTGSLPLSFTTSSDIAKILVGMQLNNRPIDYLTNYADNINNVSKDDVARLANDLLDSTKAVTILVGNPTTLGEGLLENYESVETIPNVE